MHSDSHIWVKTSLDFLLNSSPRVRSSLSRSSQDLDYIGLISYSAFYLEILLEEFTGCHGPPG